MEQRALDRTGTSVSVIGLGTSALGGGDGARTAAGAINERVRLIHRSLDAGVTLIETACDPAYGDAPELLARALAGGRRDGVRLAVTVGDTPRGSPEQLVEAVEEAMRRLKTDWIDLVLLQRTWIGDVDGALGALSELVRSEEIGAIGTSEVPLSTLVEAQWVARERFFKRFVCAQLPYSLLERDAEAELLPTCRRYRIAGLVTRPLGAGWLWGELHRGDRPLPARFDLSRVDNQRRLRRIDQLADLALELGVTLPHLALAFVLRRPGVATAVVGPRTLDQLEGLLPALELQLDAAALARIDEIAPGPG